MKLFDEQRFKRLDIDKNCRAMRRNSCEGGLVKRILRVIYKLWERGTCYCSLIDVNVKLRSKNSKFKCYYVLIKGMIRELKFE